MPQNSPPTNGCPRTPAFVVGACAHGLAIVRALSRAGIDVHVVEADPSLPGLWSRFGTKHLVSDINGPDLTDSLLELQARIAPNARPVLFLTNDRMVQSVAAASSKLNGRFALSWQSSAQTVDRLTRKTEIEDRCRDVGLNYPETVILSDWGETSQVLSTLTWPRIIKPARPLSGFKVQVASSAMEARAFLQLHQEDFPVLLQEWIPGGDSSLYFSALYLDDGKPLARFDGRKLRSYPMGHTTVAEPAPNEAVYKYATAFFDGTGVCGPASLEVKVAPDGQLWVIEPTVGRTDFWLDLCIVNGVNLPLIEFKHQTETRAEEARQLDRSVWINAERDPAGPAWYVANLGQATRWWRSVRFTYWDFSDPAPAVRGLRRFARRIWKSLWRHVRSLGAQVSTQGK